MTMGLFDKVFGVQSKIQDTLSPAEAFAAIALAAIASDGYLSDEEAHSLSVSLSRMKLFRSYPEDVKRKLFDKLLGILRRDGPGALLNSAQESLPHDLRETAFAIATDLVLADGVVTEEEKDFLGQLHESLEIPHEIGLKIVEVMLIKNRG
jgi:uncharacterized tellurite resistance protein B-like protein